MKRIMEEFEIGEISNVDKPAQRPATARLIKRAEPEGLIFAKTAEGLYRRGGLSRTDAMIAARRRNPEAFAKFRESGMVPSRPAYAKAVSNDARVAFNNAVDEVQLSRKLDRTAAMRVVRMQHPDLFEAMQA